MNAEQARQVEHYRAVRARITAPRAIQRNMARISTRLFVQHDGHVKAHAYYQHKQKISEKLARQPKNILEAVAKKYAITPESMLSKDRTHPICRARAEFFYRMRHEEKWSLQRIGNFVKRDHTTVYHGIANHERRLQEGKANV